jgi:uncharacterized protein (TIGR03435 family)
MLLFIGFASSAMLQGQSQTKPVFGVASIKRNDSVDTNSSTSFTQGGRFSSRFNPLSRFIVTAFRIKDYQLSGGPSWAYSERYDIDARAEGNPSRDEMRLMLQNLLADRFQLKIQRVKKELPVYTLVTGKRGIKFIEAPDRQTTGFKTDPGKIAGYGVSMAELADQLSRMLDRPVIDKTGLGGSFDLKLEYSPVQVQSNASSTPNASAPDILTAIEEQLGVRLEGTKAEIEVFVIDHAEKPSEN